MLGKEQYRSQAVMLFISWIMRKTKKERKKELGSWRKTKLAEQKHNLDKDLVIDVSLRARLLEIFFVNIKHFKDLRVDAIEAELKWLENDH